MSEKFEKSSSELSKDELVYTLNLLLCLQDMPKQLAKMDMKSLYRLFDQFQARGQAFSVLEEKLRDSERAGFEKDTEIAMLKRKLKKANRDLRNQKGGKNVSRN